MLISMNRRGDGEIRINSYHGSRPDPDTQIHRDPPLQGTAAEARLSGFIDVFLNEECPNIEQFANELEDMAIELRRRGSQLITG